MHAGAAIGLPPFAEDLVRHRAAVAAEGGHCPEDYAAYGPGAAPGRTVSGGSRRMGPRRSLATRKAVEWRHAGRHPRDGLMHRAGIPTPAVRIT